MTCGIYKIQNLKNGKIYIGQSINIERRWKTYETLLRTKNNPDNGTLFTNALTSIEYTKDDFNFSVLEECLKEELDNKEQYYIEYYNSFMPNGYNMTKGGQTGEHIIGKKLTKKQVKEIKELLKNTQISYKEIAEKYQIRYVLVSCINTGIFWKEINEEYPIRIPKGTIPIKKSNGIITYVKNICPICGKILTSNKTKMCRECSTKKYREEKVISKQELKKVLRKYTFKELAEIYSKSDNYFRYWAKYYNLPTKKKVIDEISQEDWDKL